MYVSVLVSRKERKRSSQRALESSSKRAARASTRSAEEPSAPERANSPSQVVEAKERACTHADTRRGTGRRYAWGGDGGKMGEGKKGQPGG